MDRVALSGNSKGEEASNASKNLITYLNEPEKHEYGSLSFEFPLETVDQDPVETKLNIRKILAQKNSKFPAISIHECWQKNFHITVTGFPKILLKNFTDPMMLAELEKTIEEYLNMVNTDVYFAEKAVLELDKKQPIQIMGDAMFIIPANQIKISVKEMMLKSLQKFVDFKPAFWVAKDNKLGVHITTDLVTPKDEELKFQLQKEIVAIFSNHKLIIGPLRATVIFHSGKLS